jgi:putative acetyltransferase
LKTYKLHQKLIEIWGSSVRATHDFLTEKNIAELEPLILKHYFDAVELRCYVDIQDRVLGVFDERESPVS